jgi:hypothetical protein
MNQIVTFNDNITKEVVVARFENLVQDIAREFGITVDKVSNINANYNLLTFNVSFKVKNPKVETRTHSTVYGTGKIVREEIKVGFKFRLKRHIFTVTGFNYKNYKNNVSVERDDRKKFKTSFDSVCKAGERV